MIHLAINSDTKHLDLSGISNESEISLEIRGVRDSNTLRAIFGLVAAFNVQHVGLVSCGIDDQAMLWILGHQFLRTCSSVDFSANRVSDGLMQGMARYSDFRWSRVSLNATEVTDGVVWALCDSLPVGLSRIYIGNSLVTDGSLECLARSHSDTITGIDISGTAVNLAGIVEIISSDFPALSSIGFNRALGASQMTDDLFVATLEKREAVSYLGIGGTAISDVAVMHIVNSSMFDLHSINLVGSRVSFAGIELLLNRWPSLSVAAEIRWEVLEALRRRAKRQ